VNATVILRSGPHASKEFALKGIGSAQKHSPDEARYERRATPNGQYFFNLTDVNHQVIGTSPLFATEVARDKGIESVRANGHRTALKELD
jgi:uncharacterized protein YegP (UPF0339 family)